MDDARHIGAAHLADAVYLSDRKCLVFYFVSDDRSQMVMARIRSGDPQALLSGFFAPKDSITAYDFSGYQPPVRNN